MREANASEAMQRNMRYDQAEAFARGVGDDEICHCGRLRPFRLCCKSASTSASQIQARILGLTLQERTQQTLDAIREYLLGGNRSDLLSIEYFTPDRVSRFYRYLSDVWPHRLRAIEALQAVRDDATLTGFFAGDPRPESILQNLARVSLYTDRVLIPQPFYLPWAMTDAYDPVQHPEVVMEDTRRWVVMTLLLSPWIRSGLVVYVPDPADYDGRLKRAFLAAGKRRHARGEIDVPDEDMKKHEQHAKAAFYRGFYGASDEVIVERVKRAIQLKEEAVPGFLAEIHRMRASDPFFLPGISGQGEQILRLQSPVIEETLLTCSSTNAFPYTDMRGKWNELLRHLRSLPADADVWSPLSRAFLECKLEFLNIDVELAYSVREDGYLSSFRQFMRELWTAINGTADENALSRVARDMADRLRHEREVAESEWRTIHKRYDAAKRNVAIGAFIGGVTTGLASDGFIGVCVSLASHYLFGSNEDRKLANELANFRVKVPMSLFLDVP